MRGQNIMTYNPEHDQIQNPDETGTVDEAPWSDWTRRVVSIGLIIVVVIALSLAGSIYGQVVTAVALCLFLFTPIRVLINRTGLSYNLSVILVFALYVVFLLFLIVLLVSPVTRFVGDVVDGLDDFTVNFIAYLQDYAPGDAMVYDEAGNALIDLDFIFGPISESFNEDSSQALSDLMPTLTRIVGSTLGVAGGMVNVTYNVFFVSVFALLFLLELPRFYRWLLRNLSWQQRRQYGIMLARFDLAWTNYLWGVAVISLIGGVSTAVLMAVLGIPNPVGIAVITAIALLIPLFGPIIGTIVSFVAALIGGSTVLDLGPIPLALLTAALFFFIRGFVIGNFVYPRIVGQSIDVPAVAVMIGLSFFGSIGGILGMLFSPVLVALVRDAGIFTLRKLNGKDPFPGVPIPGFMTDDYL